MFASNEGCQPGRPAWIRFHRHFLVSNSGPSLRIPNYEFLPTRSKGNKTDSFALLYHATLNSGLEELEEYSRF